MIRKITTFAISVLFMAATIGVAVHNCNCDHSGSIVLTQQDTCSCEHEASDCGEEQHDEHGCDVKIESLKVDTERVVESSQIFAPDFVLHTNTNLAAPLKSSFKTFDFLLVHILKSPNIYTLCQLRL